MSQQEAGFAHRFVAEAREHLAAMAAAMIALERNEDGTQPLVEELLRAAHSVKGGAGFIGRRNVERLAHAFEQAVENIRDGRIDRRPEVVDTLLVSLDRITALVDDIDHSDEADISQPLARLQLLVGPGIPPSTTSVQTREDSAATTFAVTSITPPTAPAHEFEITERLRTSWPADGTFLYGVKLDWSRCEREFGLTPLAVAERLERAGRVLESHIRVDGPALGDGLPRPPFWQLAILSSAARLDEFAGTLDIPSATVVELAKRPAAAAAAEKVEPPAADAALPRPAAAATSLRVSVPLVDRMMALAGELVLVRNQALRSADARNSTLRRLLRRLDSVTDELQDAALRMRTQPVGTLFDRVPRVVRDLARQLGKQIEVRIKGTEVELDKTILELLSDPFTHLIRNCCDHGIEHPEQRTASGKPAVGRIGLWARQERGQIVIEINDDGRGIDLDAVKRKAIEQGLRRADELERMSDRQVFGLILHSGFSTARQLTDLSGRGVGMDVVKTNLDQIGGVLEIDSAPGRGSVFTLRLPLTLAIMPCLLLRIGGQCYGAPQRDIEAIVLLDPANPRRRVERSHEGEVLRWRGRLLPVIRLREVLGRRAAFDAAAMAEVAERYHRDAAAASAGYAVVTRLGSRRFVMLFDEVAGSENIVVKPLPPLLRPLGLYAATTILGDGGVALVLSAEGVARHGGIFDKAVADTVEGLPGERSDASEGAAAAVPVLLFRCGGDELFAARMDSVRRVVMIAPASIARIGERELVNVDGIATNVIRLDHFLSVSRCGDANRFYLLLPRDPDERVGLLVSEIADTPTLALQPDPRGYRADGVLGSMMIRGQVALLIDPERVVRMWEEVNSGARPPTLSVRPARRILVVDDTAFFQKLVTEYLRGAGYEVTVAGNGSAGLAMLHERPFDLVVCDIEMPVMDGHAFARAVRAGDPSIARTPLLALTTLNTPESRDAAAASGFDAYEVKLEAKTLLASVARLLAASVVHREALAGAQADA